MSHSQTCGAWRDRGARSIADRVVPGYGSSTRRFSLSGNNGAKIDGSMLGATVFDRLE